MAAFYPDHHAERVERLRELEPGPVVHRAEPLLVGRAGDLADRVRRRACGGRRPTSARAAYDASVATYRQTVLAAFQGVEDNLAALRILEQESAACRTRR